MAINLVEVAAESIRIGVPLPFALRSEEGVLLANKGYVVGSREELETMLGRGLHFHVEAIDLETSRRAYVGQLYDLVREEKPLGQIAGTGFDALVTHTRRNQEEEDDEEPDWLDMQEQVNTLLRDPEPAHFTNRVEQVIGRLLRYLQRNPDGALFALNYLSASELQRYSATHAMQVAAICYLTARDVLRWTPQEQTLVCHAALTMNIAMVELQDRLVRQAEQLSPGQRLDVQMHASRSCEMLRARGVTQPDWLEAVLHHHLAQPGPLEGRTTAERLARLIQRADIFGAQLAPRVGRQSVTPAAAMQAMFFDENKQVDAAGSALIKAVGVYPPGTFVRLMNNETAVVVRRGGNTNAPRVAVVLNREGMPTAEHAIRDTSQPDYRVAAGVEHRTIRIVLNLAKFLPLTLSTTAARIG